MSSHFDASDSSWQNWCLWKNRKKRNSSSLRIWARCGVEVYWLRHDEWLHQKRVLVNSGFFKNSVHYGVKMCELSPYSWRSKQWRIYIMDSLENWLCSEALMNSLLKHWYLREKWRIFRKNYFRNCVHLKINISN